VRGESRYRPDTAGWHRDRYPNRPALPSSFRLQLRLGNGVAHATFDKPYEGTMLIGKHRVNAALTQHALRHVAFGRLLIAWKRPAADSLEASWNFRRARRVRGRSSKDRQSTTDSSRFRSLPLYSRPSDAPRYRAMRRNPSVVSAKKRSKVVGNQLFVRGVCAGRAISS